MPNIKLYAAIYVVLFAFATSQVLVEFAGLTYAMAATVILALSFIKAALVAGYYQHLRYEPRSVTAVMTMGLITVIALAVASTFSIF
ncbi:MAG: cytochrome C oxidase subunit IV family protein [Halodesulfurarchaeum sp.]